MNETWRQKEAVLWFSYIQKIIPYFDVVFGEHNHISVRTRFSVYTVYPEKRGGLHSVPRRKYDKNRNTWVQILCCQVREHALII